jgi:hypothetical protein
MANIQAPAVFSAKAATRKALEMKSFMNEKIAAGQIQSKINADMRAKMAEEQAKMREERMSREQKLAQRTAKENKEKATSSIADLLGKSI